jgi:hypothetical protein
MHTHTHGSIRNKHIACPEVNHRTEIRYHLPLLLHLVNPCCRGITDRYDAQNDYSENVPLKSCMTGGYSVLIWYLFKHLPNMPIDPVAIEPCSAQASGALDTAKTLGSAAPAVEWLCHFPFLFVNWSQ